jgi:hypothetical protein
MSEEETKESVPVTPAPRDTITTTIEVDREAFLKFKALCVLNQATISGEIEKLIKKRVEDLVMGDNVMTKE